MTLAKIVAHQKSRISKKIYKQLIIDCITAYGELDTTTISLYTGIKHSTVVGRASDLHDDGLIYVKRTINRVSTYKITPENMVEAVKNGRSAQKFNKWVKVGKDNKYFDRIDLTTPKF